MPAVATAAGLPSRLGKYELLMPLAAGGMARIYIGRSTGIGSFERHVVLKMITPERANDQVAVNMFLDEARLAASLNHQNVAQVFEVGEEHGIHFLAMEYVHGQDMRAVLAKAGSAGTRIPLELALTVVAGAAAGLHHAHERRGPDGQPLGIVHRDVSPSNIMVGYDGAVKLLDFGIAKAAARSVETQSGIIKGKFAYMAPEQCRGRDVDRRSDVFSLGIILYEVTTQHRCFRADSDFDTMHRIVTGDVVRPTRLVQGYPQALEAIVMKALAVDPAQRYQSAGLLLEALESFAVASRMSMSTMSLGRFMRDMFGDIQEPWLNTAATKVMQPVTPKESTISSTNGQRPSQPVIQPNPNAPEHLDPDDDDGIPDEDGAFPDSSGIAMQTILEVPRNQQPHVDRDAPTLPPPNVQQASMVPLPLPPHPVTPPGGHLLPLPPHPLTPPPPPSRPTPPPGALRRDSTPLPAQQPFATPGSGTGPSIPTQPVIPSTKHGYTSGAMTRGDQSYPLYTAPADSLHDMQLKPNRRPLFIGLGLAIVGIIVILAVSFGGSKEDKSIAPPEEEGSGSAPSTATEPTPAPAVVTPPAPAVDDAMVTVSVESDPSGADVLLAGAKIGKTPFHDKLKRGTKQLELKVHLDGYEDFTAKIDTAKDYDRSVTLSKIAEKPEGDEPADETKPEPKAAEPKATRPEPKQTKSTPKQTPKSNPTPPKPKCQPPGPNVDPFSGVPICKS